jgi:hypothetical protein
MTDMFVALKLKPPIDFYSNPFHPGFVINTRCRMSTRQVFTVKRGVAVRAMSACMLLPLGILDWQHVLYMLLKYQHSIFHFIQCHTRRRLNNKRNTFLGKASPLCLNILVNKTNVN